MTCGALLRSSKCFGYRNWPHIVMTYGAILVYLECSGKRPWPHIVMNCGAFFGSSSRLWKKRCCTLFSSFGIFWKMPWPHILLTCAVLFTSSRVFWENILISYCDELFSSSSILWKKRYSALFTSFEIFLRCYGNRLWPHLAKARGVLLGFPSSRGLCKIHTICLWIVVRIISAVITFDKCTA